MRDIKEILDSGILEEYVLGLLSPEDEKRVEDYIQSYPEVRAHVQKIELSLEKLAVANSIDPPEGTKQNILDKISNDPKGSFNNGDRFNSTVIACALTALMIGLGSWYLLNQRNNKIENLQTAYQELKSECKTQELAFKADGELLYFLRHEATYPIQLHSNKNDINSDLIVYYNPVAEKSMIKVNSLASLERTETYQLWADVNGEMKNMGIFDNDRSFVQMEYVENPESFNVTIEPKGGSDHPTVSRLILSQKV